MMQTQPGGDPYTQALARLIAALAEDAIFALASAGRGHPTALEALGKRRTEAYTAVLHGTRLARMTEGYDSWVIELTRAIAPIAPPTWMPMAELLGEKVTLEVGARGIRSLFSSKPSEKDVQRVKRLGTLATRLLRAVFAADGPIDAEEARALASFIGALGLPDSEATPLYTEAPILMDHFEVYGDLEPGVARALVAGGWHAAACDAIDPREEAVIRTFGGKIGFPAEEVERLRAEAVERVEEQRVSGLASLDAVRYILSDRMPGLGTQLATCVGTLTLPRRYREEALAQVTHGTPVTLAKRHGHTTSDDRLTAMGIAWAASLWEDPTMARRALLRARHDRVAQDFGDEGERARILVDEWMSQALLPVAFNMK